jgi:hypothetical protein
VRYLCRRYHIICRGEALGYIVGLRFSNPRYVSPVVLKEYETTRLLISQELQFDLSHDLNKMSAEEIEKKLCDMTHIEVGVCIMKFLDSSLQ